MEGILKNLEQFAEVLAVSRSKHVSDWDSQTVERAFQWAAYFKHIWNRSRTNVVVKQAMEARLKQINSELSNCFDYFTFISFDNLGHSEEILFVSLLTNNALSKSAYERVLVLLKQSNAVSDVLDSIAVLSSKKATCHVLFRACVGISKRCSFIEDPFVKTEADLLLDCLIDRMEMSVPLADCSPFLNEVLGTIPSEYLNRLLLTIVRNENSKFLPAVEMVVNWLIGNRCQMRYFCSSQECKVLCELVVKHNAFKTAYLDLLVEWARDMEYDISCAEWISTKCSDVSWKGLVEHFNTLLEGPIEITKETKKLLRTLKVEDGDMDVCGVSVWTDLFCAVHTVL
ncbi:Fanconi anemia group F protein [Protopterus annectens]|uniref:Fanconi anemia group F protein n=1 Tax=Protopterus annectens TaxID=7888 RepID=UPI001CF9EC9E|nr:Fanconi anemia group F protein [Protopterus annectens]